MKEFFELLTAILALITAVMTLIKTREEDQAYSNKGNSRSSDSLGSSPFQVPEIDAAVIGSGVQYWWNKFQRFRLAGSDQFTVSWNWGSCLLGPAWFLYRKAYPWAGIFFLLEFSSSHLISDEDISTLFTILIGIIEGITGNYLYYLTVKGKVQKISELAGVDRDEALRIAHIFGGVNRWAIWLGVGYYFIEFLGSSEEMGTPEQDENINN